MTLFETRNYYKLSQIEASKIAGIPVRTFRRYESDENYGSEIKREAFIFKIVDKCEITEEKGILSVELIKKELTDLFDNEYKGKINFCYLFGSYAKGMAKENSDVDLYISSSLTGLKFVGLIETIRQRLNKKIDLIRESELENNLDLINEILSNGIKIYGK